MPNVSHFNSSLAPRVMLPKHNSRYTHTHTHSDTYTERHVLLGGLDLGFLYVFCFHLSMVPSLIDCGHVLSGVFLWIQIILKQKKILCIEWKCSNVIIFPSEDLLPGEGLKHLSFHFSRDIYVLSFHTCNEYLTQGTHPLTLIFYNCNNSQLLRWKRVSTVLFSEETQSEKKPRPFLGLWRDFVFTVGKQSP